MPFLFIVLETILSGDINTIPEICIKNGIAISMVLQLLAAFMKAGWLWPVLVFIIFSSIEHFGYRFKKKILKGQNK